MMPHKSARMIAVRRLHIDFVCALAASFCAATFTLLIHLLKPRESEVLVYARFILMALVAYFSVALILQQFWKEELRRMLPNWILISVFGSLFFVALRLLPAVISAWSGPTITEPSLANYMATEAAAARSLIVFLSFITLPVTALIYYADSVLKAVRRWHNTAPPPSIWSTPSTKK